MEGSEQRTKRIKKENASHMRRGVCEVLGGRDATEISAVCIDTHSGVEGVLGCFDRACPPSYRV